jgi:amino acid transporter
MKKVFKQILILICLIAILILPYFVFAQQSTAPLDKLKEVGEGEGGYAPYSETTFAVMAGTIVQAFLSLLGIIFIILILYAGYNWMTAGGEEEKIRKAKDTIWRAIIGLIITVGSYAVWNFVFKYLIES